MPLSTIVVGGGIGGLSLARELTIAREERPARRERDVKQAPKVNLR